MQIIETKNNLAKILYNPEQENLVLSGFVTVRDNTQMFLAQVISLESNTEKNYAIIKFLFNFDNQGNITSYNGGVPAVNAELQSVKIQDVAGVLNVSEPFIMGKISSEDVNLIEDKTVLEKMLVCVEKQNEKEDFIKMILPQILNDSGKVVLFDTLGTYNLQNKLVAGENFKLPLNYETINFIYEKGLTDASGETKALIQDIFLEVQNYVRQIPEKFIPFENFKAVVDAQYQETQLNELVLLKNKLLKFYENGVFAQDKSDFQILKEVLKNNSVVVIDISKFNGILQREFISYVYKVMKETVPDIYSVLEIDDDNTDKKLLKQIFVTVNVKSILISPYKYKYLKEIKQLSKNLVLFAPIHRQDDFAGYNVLLGKLNHNEFISYGDNTKYIPFIASTVTHIEQTQAVQPQQQNYVQENVTEDIQPDNSEIEIPEQSVPEVTENIQEEISVQTEPEYNEEQVIPTESNIVEEISQEIQDEPVISPEVQETSEDINNIPDEEIYQNIQEEIPQNIQEDIIPQQEEIISDSEIPANEYNEDAVNQEIINDIDEMQSIPASEVQNDAENMLTDDDLDFIEQNISPDDMEFQEQIQEPQEIVQPIQDEIQEEMIQQDTDTQEIPQELQENYEEEQEFKETPIVPVYPAEAPEENVSNETFEQGDEVMHETYGHGVVTKIISYGEKVLCSIEFDTEGKKLLDPAITKLTKI